MNFIRRKYYQFLIELLVFFNACDKKISKAKYFYKNNKKLNLDNPTEFMEKLQWLKLYYYKENYGHYVDKYEVREFVKNQIGEQYLNDFIAIYENENDIDFDLLPNQFALKGIHGSGYNIIVEDKRELDIIKAKKTLKKYLQSDYSSYNEERIYKNIKPRILAEKYLDQSCKSAIIDYKLFCFHGKAKYIWVKTYLNGSYKNCYYDLNWNRVKDDLNKKSHLNIEIEKPNNLKEMIEISNKLAENFIFVRVDLYSIKNKIYFGELTFFPWGGKKRLTVERFNKEFGDLIKLPF